MRLERLKEGLLKAFVVLGPLGNLLTPQLITNSFRAYYFILLCFPVFYFPLQKRVAKVLIFTIPLLVYCVLSSFYAYHRGFQDYPFSRLTLFLTQFLFVLGAASFIKTYDQIVHLIKLYIKSFVVSLFIGYIFYIGYYLSLIPLSFLDRFSVLTQIGYGFLRFSPGSYPNEYGIVASFFLSIITFLLLNYKDAEHLKFYSKSKLLVLFVLAFIALLLTTTRSAYLSYCIMLCYFAWKKRNLFRVLSLTLLGCLLIATLLLCFGINIFDILKVGFSVDTLETGSLGDRMREWKKALELFKLEPFLGVGFSAQCSLHNLYLQILFELGIVGLFITSVTLAFFLFEKGFIRRKSGIKESLSFQNKFVHLILVSGIVHVLWFAGSNHNLNHHLTWFVALLCFSLPRKCTIQSERGLPSLGSAYFTQGSKVLD